MDDFDLFGFLYDEPDLTTEPTATCKYCGKENLYWNSIHDKWVLCTESGKPHKCRETAKHKKQWAVGYEKVISGERT